MYVSSKYLRIFLTIIAWLIFVGLGIEAGSFITNFVATLLYSPAVAKRLWTEVDLSAVYTFNQSYYVSLGSIMIIATVLKALLFYFIIRLLYNKQLDLSRPFNETVRRFTSGSAWIALGIGLFCFWGAGISRNIEREGVNVPDVEKLRLGGADVWLFMAVTLFIMAFIFRKGMEIQNENELTV